MSLNFIMQAYRISSSSNAVSVLVSPVTRDLLYHYSLESQFLLGVLGKHKSNLAVTSCYINEKRLCYQNHTEDRSLALEPPLTSGKQTPRAGHQELGGFTKILHVRGSLNGQEFTDFEGLTYWVIIFA